jgi:hypothetical protein
MIADRWEKELQHDLVEALNRLLISKDLSDIRFQELADTRWCAQTQVPDKDGRMTWVPRMAPQDVATVYFRDGSFLHVLRSALNGVRVAKAPRKPQIITTATDLGDRVRLAAEVMICVGIAEMVSEDETIRFFSENLACEFNKKYREIMRAREEKSCSQ